MFYGDFRILCKYECFLVFDVALCKRHFPVGNSRRSRNKFSLLFCFLRQQLLSAIADGSAPRRLCEARFSVFGIVCFLLFYSTLIYSSLLYSYLIYSYLFLSFLIYSYLGGDVGRRVGRFFLRLSKQGVLGHIFLGTGFEDGFCGRCFYDIDLGTQ